MAFFHASKKFMKVSKIIPPGHRMYIECKYNVQKTSWISFERLMRAQIMPCIQGAITVFQKRKLACKILGTFSDMSKDEVVEIKCLA